LNFNGTKRNDLYLGLGIYGTILYLSVVSFVMMGLRANNATEWLIVFIGTVLLRVVTLAVSLTRNYRWRGIVYHVPGRLFIVGAVSSIGVLVSAVIK